VTYAGLAPGLAGLYQVNVQIPSNVGPSNVYVEFITDFADVNMVQVPVAAASSANQAGREQPARAQPAGSQRRLHPTRSR